jgi:hypothetical protein
MSLRRWQANLVANTEIPQDELTEIQPEGEWEFVIVRDWWPFGKQRGQWRFTFADAIGERGPVRYKFPEVKRVSPEDPPVENAAEKTRTCRCCERIKPVSEGHTTPFGWECWGCWEDYIFAADLY